jgi:hypothetical protein
MGVFNYLFPAESPAMLISDIFVWFVPLLLFEIYWRIEDSRVKPANDYQQI